MYSKMKIFNIALAFLNEKATNENIETLKDFYPIARDKVLKECHWDFATSYEQLIYPEVDSVNPKFSYSFRYPDSCLFAIEIIGSKGKKNEFEISTDEKGKKVINTNECPVILKYTRLIEDEKIYPSDFVNCLAACLAYMSAYAITRNIAVVNDCIDLYETLLLRQGET